MIEIKETEGFKFEYSHIYPNVMIKDGKEYFIINRVVPYENKYHRENYEKVIKTLQATDGLFTICHGAYTNPFDMLQDICMKKHKIIRYKKRIFEPIEDGIIEFSGDRDTYSSDFMYKIFDLELVNKLKEIVGLINNEQWDKAKVKIKERREEYKEMLDKTKGLDYYGFYQMIDRQIEKVRNNPNYEIFKADIDNLKNANEGVGFASITANKWLKLICNLSESELNEYVSNYKKNLLDSYNEQQEEIEP